MEFWFQTNKQTKIRLIHQNLPTRVHKRTGEEKAVHGLVQQPIKDHLPVPGANGHPQLEAAAADRTHVHHLHVKGDGRAEGDGRQLIGHLFTVDKHNA